MASDGNARTLIVGLAVFAVLASGAGLFWLMNARGGGTPAVALPVPMAAPAAPAAAPGAQGLKGAPTMVDAADRLSKRLAKSDGSADDWALLGRTYVELQQYPDAVAAFARALEKSPGDEKLKQDAAAASKAAAAPSSAR